MPRLREDEMETFLQEKHHLARVGTIDDDGMPRVLPFWFIVTDETLYFTPRSASVVLANLRRDPRVCVSIDEDEIPYRKVTIQASSAIAYEPGGDDVWRDLYRAICRRYVPADEAEKYIQDTIDQPRALISISLAASRITTWRLPTGDENKTGIWAKRYFEPGTKMAQLASRGEAAQMYRWTT